MKYIIAAIGVVLMFIAGFSFYHNGRHDAYEEIFSDKSYEYLQDYKLSLPEDLIVIPEEQPYDGEYLIVHRDHTEKTVSIKYSVIPPEYILTVDKLGISIYSGFRLLDQVQWDSTHLIKDIILNDNE